MAKGDGSTSQQAMQNPKMDQYSVMHGIMDRLSGSPSGSIAPSPGTSMPMPMPSNNGGVSAMPRFGGGGQMGGPFGQYGRDFTPMGQGSMGVQPQGILAGDQFGGGIAPTNIQDVIRRRLMGNNVSGPQ